MAVNSTATLESQDVGLIFVREYYTFLNKKPHRLHAFYNKDSLFVRGDEGTVTVTVQGQEEIRKKIEECHFEDCKVLVTQVDSQVSANNGILIQVLGEMCNQNGPSQKFSQTFFLATQPNGYYVLNDIFRFLKDEVEIDYYTCDQEDNKQAEKAAAAAAAELKQAEVKQQQEQAELKRVQQEEEKAKKAQAAAEAKRVEEAKKAEEAKRVEEAKKAEEAKQAELKQQAEAKKAEEAKQAELKQQQAEAKRAEEAKATAEAKAAAAAAEAKQQAELRQQQQAESVVIDIAPSPVAPSSPVVENEQSESKKDKKMEEDKKKKTESKGQPKKEHKSKTSTPKTWANLVAPTNGTVTPTEKAVPSSPVVNNAEKPQYNASTPPPQQQQQQQPQQQQTQQQPQQQQQQQNKNQNTRREATNIYVKQVSDSISDDQLQEVFNRFGSVKSCSIARQKGCAFIEFYSPESCQKALAQHRVQVGSHTVLAEERKFQSGGYKNYNNNQNRNSQQQQPYDRRTNNTNNNRRGGGATGSGSGQTRMNQGPGKGRGGVPNNNNNTK